MQWIDDIPKEEWKAKRVLLRVGFDMGKEFGAMEEFRITAGLPTIQYLLDAGACVVILNHNGRPEGKEVPELSNAGIAKRLGQMLKREVPLLPLATSSLPATGDVFFLENLRFDPREEANDMDFAKELAQLGDAYVNEAFPNCHRAHASMVALASLLPRFGGLHLKLEYTSLLQVRENPEKPFILVMGGTKGETKMRIVKRFWDKTDGIILGGVLANTFLHAKGIATGKSLVEMDAIGDVDSVELTDTRLHLPVDVRVAKDFEGKEGVRVAPVGKLAEDEIILDIGPDTELLFDNIVKSAKMIVWNGPLGKFEVPAFSQGTKSLLASLIASGARVLTGGGETVQFLEDQRVMDKFSFVSTGGGAMLSFLANDPMPALDALQSTSSF